MTDKDKTDDAKDPQGAGPGDVPPEAGKVAEQLDAKQEEAEKLEEKLNEPGLTDRERDKVGERLDALDSQIAGLGKKLDQLISSPVAPSPRRSAEDAPKESAGEGGQPPKDKEAGAAKEPPAKPPFSKAWWGSRAAG
ncbi:MAG: hypothetical protein HOV84_17490 [Streptomyces sp.]|nr:hypothetical protein [Streptomyces sp.]